MVSDSPSEIIYLSKQTIRERMIEELPDHCWGNIGILNWMPGDNELPVEFSDYDSTFGKVLIANTPLGVCYLGLINNASEYAYQDFQNRFGYANPVKSENQIQKTALDYLNGNTDKQLVLHLKGTSYQINIWERLLQIPSGWVITYTTLAGNSSHARAAGTAIGRNPIFYLVPCHRVVNSDGSYDQYFWGKDTKTKLLRWEFDNSDT